MTNLKELILLDGENSKSYFRMNQNTNVVVLALTLIVLSYSGYCQDIDQKIIYDLKRNTRVTIFPLESKMPRSVGWYDRRSLTEGMYDILTRELVKSGKFTVIERQQLETVLKEQGLQSSGLMSDQTAVKLGRMLGVEIGIFAIITDFSTKKEKESLFGITTVTSKATFSLDVRLVDVKTGEILLADNVKRTEVKDDVGIKITAGKKKFVIEADDEFKESVIGKAVDSGIKALVSKIDEVVKKIPWQASVTNVLGERIVINVGLQSGVKGGYVFDIYNKGEEIIDPATGISLGFIQDKIATIEIVKNDLGGGKASMCKIIEKNGVIQPGFFVKLPEGVLLEEEGEED